MDTPPYSDVSLQLSPGANALHVNGDQQPNALAHPNGLPPPGPSSAIPASDLDFRTLYSSSWSALETPTPPSLRDILTAYRQKGDGDRETLLAMLSAKSAEDQRIASQLSLRRAMLEVNRYSAESRSPSHSQLQYPQSSHSHGHGHHMYTYVPDEPYALAAPNHHHHHRQQHHAVSASPPAVHHTYASGYSSHSQGSRSHGHLRAVESPPLSSTTQKSVLSATRVRPASLSGSHSRGSVRLPDARSQVHSVPQPQSQISSRRKRPRPSRSRSRSPGPMATASPSHRAYAYTYSHSAAHSHAHSELDAERSSYSSGSEAGSPRSVPNAYVPRTMAIGSLLSAAKAGNSTPSTGPISNSRANGRVKDERLERTDRELDLDPENEQESLLRERKRDRDER